MEDTSKYLIHAGFVADGVIERSDVVGAVFGQTEGLLGDELELRDLQESSKLGRIDVEVESEAGQSHGTITIASSLDRVETATLGAALEAIERIGPSHATIEISRIEDVRAAKRREIVERAKELLATAFDESVMDSRAILEEVRESIRVEDITEYEGLPAGPHVGESDAVIVVEGRSDVRTLLRYGIKNAIAVEGTNVPEAVAELTRGKTVTAFLDGDRGGDLIRRELQQVGELDYIALTPEGKSVEDLSRGEVHRALREKIPVEALEEGQPTAVPNGSPVGAVEPGARSDPDASGRQSGTTPGEGVQMQIPEAEEADPAVGAGATPSQTGAVEPDAATMGGSDAGTAATDTGETLQDHLDAVESAGVVRLLDGDQTLLSEHDAEEAFEALRDTVDAPDIVLLDGEVTQRLVDVASQQGVGTIVGATLGEFVKQPTGVRVRTFEEF